MINLRSNLKKDGSMDVGQVSFHSDKKVKRTHVAERSNVIINRLNKTKKVVEVDHIAEQVEREKEQARLRRLEATERVRQRRPLPSTKISGCDLYSGNVNRKRWN